MWRSGYYPIFRREEDAEELLDYVWPWRVLGPRLLLSRRAIGKCLFVSRDSDNLREDLLKLHILLGPSLRLMKRREHALEVVLACGRGTNVEFTKRFGIPE